MYISAIHTPFIRVIQYRAYCETCNLQFSSNPGKNRDVAGNGGTRNDMTPAGTQVCFGDLIASIFVSHYLGDKNILASHPVYSLPENLFDISIRRLHVNMDSSGLRPTMERSLLIYKNSFGDSSHVFMKSNN